MNLSYMNKLKFLYYMDLFGKEPELYYKGKTKRTSWIGIVFTLLYFIIYIIIFIYKFVKMIKKSEISFYETYVFSGGIPSITITKENFNGGLAIGQIPLVDETIYYPKVEYYRGERINGEMHFTNQNIEIKICELDDFDPRYREIFKDKPLNNLYCFKDLNLTLEGYNHLDTYSYLYVSFYACINRTKDGRPCKNSLEIDQFLYSNIYQFFIQDINLSPQYYDNPIQIEQKIIQGPLYKKLYQRVYAYMQIVNIETDKDFIGLNAFSKSKKEQYLKYDEAWIVSAPNEGQTYDKGYPICDFRIQLSDKVLTQKRTFVKLIEILGDVGGTMEVILTIFNIMSSFITTTLYRTSLVNNLFSFDIQKRIIFIKENKNDKIEKFLSDKNAE